MTVFGGGGFSHRFKLIGFKRHSQQNVGIIAEAATDANANATATAADTAATTAATTADASVAATISVHKTAGQSAANELLYKCQRLVQCNSSNSTVSQQQVLQQHQRQLQAAPGVAESRDSSVHRPPRQQIIIPGDNSKNSDDEEGDKQSDAEDTKHSDEAGAAAADSKQEPGQKTEEAEVVAAASEESEVTKCPTGKHQNKKDAVCSCILLEQFAEKVTTPVISEWHSSAAIAAASAANDPENSSAAASSTVALSDFKLARSRVFQGGQGVVYIVRSSGTGEELVMKFKERRKKQRTKSWKRDLREVFLLKDLRHPFIIDMKHAYLTNNFYCLVMDYGSRGSLWSMVCRHGCMPKPIAAYYVACILSAVRYVHKNNFIFRDLKAENVVVMNDYRPKLIDFGMAKSHNKPSVRNTSTSFYFAAYIAPEVYADPKGVTEKVDSWGIGYLALELTVGLGVFKSLPWSQTKHTAPEWRFEMPRRYASRIGRDSCRFVEKALDRRPEKRPSLDQLMEFQFLEDIDFRLLPSLKPKGIEAYLSKKAEN